MTSKDAATRGPDVFAERYRFRDFLHFIELFAAGLDVLRTADDLLTVADALTAELAEQRVAARPW